MTSTKNVQPLSAPEFLAGGGEMGKRILEFDWDSTELGPLEKWPQSLKTCVRIMLTSRQPIWIGWGPNLLKMYNDAYLDIVGGKHPWALGLPARVVWKDIWDDIAPMLRTVMEDDQGTYVESQLLIMERNGYPEETYYTFSYTPIPGDDGKTAGMFCANTDDTARIIHERQLGTLSSLAKRLIDCKTEKAIYAATIDVLKDNPYDFPFTIIRTVEGDKAVLAASSPLGDSASLVVPVIDLQSTDAAAEIIRTSFQKKQPQISSGIVEKIGNMPKGAWRIPPDKSMVFPLMLTGNTQPVAVIVFGLNPYRAIDEKYLSFFSLLADQIMTSILDVRSQEAERQRIQALAELDKAKSIFFSNISHEFRTPLTLMLGPIEEVIMRGELKDENRGALELALRNGLRMQKLVNNLLDFSRAEAGRLTGRFKKVDIVAFTRELSNLFQPVVENAGLGFTFTAEDIRGDVYVDTEMWEKIVVNLLSNAFKYTEKGAISVTVTSNDHTFCFKVCDTGVGIADDQQDKIFDRFHRVANSGGRSQEGTGIGLAMVKELVRVHKGYITVESRPGKGSCFQVELPLGKNHLLHEMIVDATENDIISNAALPVLEEAKKWDTEHEKHGPVESDRQNKAPKILLVDDNADMREYVSKVLREKFEMHIAHDGAEAYNMVEVVSPDLIISDIMMPRMDGYQLVAKLREHPATKHIPIIFLSAKAGEEAKIEGLQAGVDDYLVKPFSARELLVRAEANIRISKSRAAAEKNLRSIFLQAPAAIALLTGKSMKIELANKLALEVWGREEKEVINKPLVEALPEIEAQGFIRILEEVYATGKPYIGTEVPIELKRFGKNETVYLNFVYEPLRDPEEGLAGILALGVDVTPMVIARKKIEQSEQELRTMANAMTQLVWVANSQGEVVYFNDRIRNFIPLENLANGNWDWEDMVYPEDREETHRNWSLSLNSGEPFNVEHRLQMNDGTYRWHLTQAVSQKSESGDTVKWFGTTSDIHDTREETDRLEILVKNRTKELEGVNSALKKSNDDLLQFAHVASHDLKEPVRKIKTFTSRFLSEVQTLGEKQKGYLHKVMSAAERMNAMIEGVLNYSTVNAARQPIQKIDLKQVLKNVQSDLEIVIQQKAATIKTMGDFEEIEGAPVLIHQLFYNLINNALKFSKTDVPPVISIRSEVARNGDEEVVKLEVEDNGIGFEPEYSRTIFDTFIRLNSKDQFEGTGIGLALCEKIVMRHRGTISAEGKLGVGARFHITLPLKQIQETI